MRSKSEIECVDGSLILYHVLAIPFGHESSPFFLKNYFFSISREIVSRRGNVKNGQFSWTMNIARSFGFVSVSRECDGLKSDYVDNIGHIDNSNRLLNQVDNIFHHSS